jgi:hypothetical protein
MPNAIVQRLSEALATAAGQREAVSLIIYTPFGIVRGEVTPAQVRAAAGDGDGVIEVRRATVEHYSNHLPTGNYASLHLNLPGISGFAIIPD